VTQEARETKDTHEVELSIHIDATPATVFQYFVDPERLCRWQGIRADIDPRPGGTYRVHVAGDNVAVGQYVDVVRDERVVFTWGWEGNDGLPPGTTTVEVTLAPDGDGTLVRLRHYDLPTDDAAARHREGWQHYLKRLQVAGAGGDPGRDTYLDAH
jgi:uncharacterized protein YndB with AHSA1/START domain